MRLDAASRAKQSITNNKAILVYGPSKSGKTRLVGTAAQLDYIDNIYWIDIENGSETLVNMGLSEAELSKFILYKIPDTRDNPRANETVLKMLTSKVPVEVCNEHGQVSCVECAKDPNKTSEKFFLPDCTPRDIVVIDSGSQLGVSAMNASMMGKPATAKPEFDNYGFQGKILSDALLVIQQAKNTNFVVITHELLTDEGEDGVERIYPLMGTKAFSANVPKYFGTVIHTHVKLSKHGAASSSTYRNNLVTGSRSNVVLDKDDMVTMAKVLATK